MLDSVTRGPEEKRLGCQQIYIVKQFYPGGYLTEIKLQTFQKRIVPDIVKAAARKGKKGGGEE
jgi:hypothetical protein